MVTVDSVVITIKAVLYLDHLDTGPRTVAILLLLMLNVRLLPPSSLLHADKSVTIYYGNSRDQWRFRLR